MSYLAPYIFRVAITNRRIVSLNDDPAGGLFTITFRYRPSGSRFWRLCTVPVLEFIRRFLQHVLPQGFVKTRYYGFFSSGNGYGCGTAILNLAVKTAATLTKSAFADYRSGFFSPRRRTL